MHGITKKQREIVDFIEKYVQEKRYSPSFREIQSHFGFSSLGTVYNHIRALKKRGALQNTTREARSLQLQEQKVVIEVPLIGLLRGGMPIETFAQSTAVSFFLPAHLTNQAYYFLRVAGTELEEEWIKEGDLLLVDPKAVFEEAEMVIAQIYGQTTLVKRAFKEYPYIRLESDNPNVQPMILREDHLRILGVIVALHRDYSS